MVHFPLLNSNKTHISGAPEKRNSRPNSRFGNPAAPLPQLKFAFAVIGPQGDQVSVADVFSGRLA